MFCGCTSDDPRRLPDGDESSFVSALVDCCNYPRCLIALDRARKDGRRRTNSDRKKLVGDAVEKLKRGIVERREQRDRRRRRKLKGRAA